MFSFFKKKHKLEELSIKIPRHEVVTRSRILVIDDEKPDLIDDLKGGGFSVDYLPDVDSANMAIFERMIYDLVILDFADVGKEFGEDQGLSLLHHIKRVSPSTVVYAYTSKLLGAAHHEFYTRTDGVLRKDAGIGETTDKVEQGLEKARSLQNVWKGMLHAAQIVPGSQQDEDWQDLYVRMVKKHQIGALREKFSKVMGSEAGQQVGLILVERLIEIGANYYLGGSK